MGSEGRGEQLLKTDQDNGLILRDGCAVGDARRRPRRASASPRRCATSATPTARAASWSATRRGGAAPATSASAVRNWLLRPDPEGLMALAIFIDAHAVAGDAALLAGVRGRGRSARRRRRRAARPLRRGDRLVPRRVAAAGGTGCCRSASRTRQTLDLKKAGIFPIVHGVRSLALREHVQATGTAARHRRAGGRRARCRPSFAHRPRRQPALPDGAEAQGRPGRARHRRARSAAACAPTG